MQRLYRLLRAGLLTTLFGFGGFLVFDALSPMPLHDRPVSRSVLAADGRLLRGFADEQGQWRYRTHVGRVSPYYLEALIGYEDRFFRDHPGVNPVSLLRAAWQWQRHGEVVSGGSTLTMQVVRLSRPRPRTLASKAREILGALQLEWHYSKDEILDWYLNHAPFGGVLEGVEAAAWSYYGHGADDLTRAQAALLAVLPQAPSLYRPDRHPQRARAARDKLLQRLARQSVWSHERVQDALLEPIEVQPLHLARHAPLLARRLRDARDKARLLTPIDSDWQMRSERLLRDYAAGIGERVSAAALVMDNRSGEIRVYAGSADFTDARRFGHVDMVQALRSPGSTLKPFIYGMALDRGLIHSESLLMDAPLRFADYQPDNFGGGFSGPVSVSQALQRSLNVPAVQVLERLEPKVFFLGLYAAGLRPELPRTARPNLAMALGGLGLSLEDLVSAYASLANQGRTLRPRLTSDQARDERPLLSPGAAWIVRRMLLDADNPAGGMAVKTGTSYGFRDAWALGVDDRYTLGVWVGRPDGTPLPGHYGGLTAVPLLQMIRQVRAPARGLPARPSSVAEASICWPAGTGSAADCDQRRRAWVLDGVIPPTWMETAAMTRAFLSSEVELPLARDSGLRLRPGCGLAAQYVSRSLWPAAVQSWLPTAQRSAARLPDWDPRCRGDVAPPSLAPLRLVGVHPGDAFQVAAHQRLQLVLDARGGEAPYHWLLDSRPIARTQRLPLQLEPGRSYHLTLLDAAGQSETRRIVVRALAP